MRSLLLILVIAAGCTDEQPVETRECNRTGFEIVDLQPRTDIALGVRADDACTSYRSAHEAYAYAGATFRIGNDRFEYQPVDFVGEEPLPPGRWTYEIRIVDYALRTISVNAVED